MKYDLASFLRETSRIKNWSILDFEPTSGVAYIGEQNEIRIAVGRRRMKNGDGRYILMHYANGNFSIIEDELAQKVYHYVREKCRKSHKQLKKAS